ncbi:hypothetical protein HN51_039186 [Arachis hypogaea]
MIKESAPNMTKDGYAGSLAHEVDEDSERTMSWDVANGVRVAGDVTSVRRWVGRSNSVVLNNTIAQSLLTKAQDIQLGLRNCSPRDKFERRVGVDQAALIMERGPGRVGSGEGIQDSKRINETETLQGGVDVTQWRGRPQLGTRSVGRDGLIPMAQMMASDLVPGHCPKKR